jgi:hypothetical protein
MEVSNDDIARILGRLEAKLDGQVSATKRVEDSLAGLEAKVSRRLDDHDQRLRDIEQANPAKTAAAVKDLEARTRALEQGAARTGVFAGIGSSLIVAAIIEAFRR